MLAGAKRMMKLCGDNGYQSAQGILRVDQCKHCCFQFLRTMKCMNQSAVELLERKNLQNRASSE